MVKPIRRDLLIHNVEYTPKGEHDPWGGGTTESEQINFVRLEPKTKLAVGGSGNQVDSDTTLFWDATFSTPATFEVEGKIKWQNKDYTIVSVDEYYDRIKLHHLEVRLI